MANMVSRGMRRRGSGWFCALAFLTAVGGFGSGTAVAGDADDPRGDAPPAVESTENGLASFLLASARGDEPQAPRTDAGAARSQADAGSARAQDDAGAGRSQREGRGSARPQSEPGSAARTQSEPGRAARTQPEDRGAARTQRRDDASAQSPPARDDAAPASQPDDDTPPVPPPAPVTGSILADIDESLPGAFNLTGADIEVEVVGDAVMIRGSEQDVALLELLVTALDRSVPGKVARLVKLEKKDANEVGRTLQEAINQALTYPNQREEEKVSITAVSPTVLLVAAVERDIDFVVDMIRQVDQIEDVLGPIELMTFEITNRKAREIVTELDEILKQILATKGIQDANSKFQIKAIDANNTILVTAPESERETIQKFISVLDVEPAEGWGKVKLTLFPLLRSDADEMAGTITDLLDEGSEDTQEVIRRLQMSVVDPSGEMTDLAPIDLDKPIKIIADSGTNSLIVSTVEENVGPLGELIHLMDNPALAEALTVRVFPIQHGDAEAMVTLMNEMFDKGKQLPEEPVGNKGTETIRGTPDGAVGRAMVYNITLVADLRTNTLIAAGRPDQMELVQLVIRELDQPTKGFDFNLRLIHLTHSDATRVAKLITDLAEQRIASLEATGTEKGALERERVFTTVDIRTNTLLLKASDANYAEITELVNKIDTAPAQVFDNIRVIPCRRLSATAIKDQIDELWQRKADLRSDLELPEDRPVIVADDRSNALVVASSLEDFDEIAALINTLENQPRIDGTELFQLRHADANVLAAMLVDLFQKMASQMESMIEPTILPDPRTNTLVVAATQDTLERVESLIQRLDVEAGPQTAVFEIYRLRYASATNLATKMQELFDSRRQGANDQTTPIVIMPAEAANGLIVSASNDDHAVVMDLLGLLDQPSSLAKQFAIFPLERARATQVATKLTDLFSAAGGDTRPDAMATAADERTNSLIVWAAPGEMENIAEMVQRLDQAGPMVKRAVKLIQLKQALAEDFATMLSETIVGENPGGDDEETVIITYTHTHDDGTVEQRRLLRQDITITPDTRTNSIMVMAPEESMSMLESMIRDFDSIRPIQSQLLMMPMINADATQMAEQLTELFTREGSGGDEPAAQITLGDQLDINEFARVGQELKFAADKRTNTLVVAGAEVDLRMVEQYVQFLDSQQAEDRIVGVYQAANRGAQELAQAVRDFNQQEQEVLGALEDETAQRILAERQISVQSIGDEEEGSSRLIYGTSRNRYGETMDLLSQLDRPEPQVMLSVLIAEVTVSDDVELGIEIAGQDLQFSEEAFLGPNGIIQGPNFDYVGGTDLGAIGSALGFNFTVTGEDFSFLLHALQQENRVEVLSNPILLVRNGDEGRIVIADSIPIVSSTQITDAGNTQSTVGREDVGINFTATPHISPDGFVTIAVLQSIDNFSGENIQLTEGVTQPVFTNREVETNVTLKDGETVVIGGLMTRRESHGETKIPLLGDVPYLGELFKTRSTSSQKTELLVVMTAEILRTPEHVRSASERARDRWELPDTVRQSPHMGTLRITPDMSELGPKDADGKPSTKPDGSTRDRQPDGGQFGPKPKTYGPSINRPKTTNALPSATYGPRVAQSTAVEEEG